MATFSVFFLPSLATEVACSAVYVVWDIIGSVMGSHTTYTALRVPSVSVRWSDEGQQKTETCSH